METASTIIIEKQIMFLLNTKEQEQSYIRTFWKALMDSSCRVEHLLNNRQLKLKIGKYGVMHMGKTILTLCMKRQAVSFHHHPGVKSWGYDSCFCTNMNLVLGISQKAIQILGNMKERVETKTESIVIVTQNKSVDHLWLK